MKFNFEETGFKDLFIIQRLQQKDTRGFFSRFFCDTNLKEVGFNKPIKQINHTLTMKKGAWRGLHFQRHPYAEMKMVSCMKGEIMDFAIDLRTNSPTYLKSFSTILSSENSKSLLIPEGYAHGFQTLSDDCELIYLHTEVYQPKAEGGLNYRDPILDIKLPLNVSEISERDNNFSFIDNTFQGITL